MRTQYFSKASPLVSAFMSGRGTETKNLGKRSRIIKITPVAAGRGRDGTLAGDNVESDNGIFLTGGVQVLMGVTGGVFESEAGKGRGHHDSGVNPHGGPVKELMVALLEAHIAKMG